MLHLAALLLQVSLVANSDILPRAFSGWQAGKVEKFSEAELTAFAGRDAAVLREFGFLAAERKKYTHEASQISVEALRMRDASAAYGLFTFYRGPDWRTDGDKQKFQAAFGPNQTVLFRNSYCVRVLDGELPRAELEKLVSALPTFHNEPLPTIPDFLPAKNLDRSSMKYVTGPHLSALLAPQVPAMTLGYEMGAEAALAQYRLPGKQPMTMMLVLFPTPQIAILKAKALAALNDPPFVMRRRGSLVSLVLNAPKEDADVLLDRVKYSMDVMWNQAVSKKPRENAALLILNILKLCGIVILFAFLSGIFHGVVRLIGKRWFPDRIFDTDMEVIRLNLSN